MKKVRRASLGVLLTLIAASAAFAAGTPAGTVIQSRSKVIYTTASGATSDTLYSNYVSFTVAQIAAVNRTPASNAVTTSSDSVNVDYAMSVTNSGNGTDNLMLSKNSSKGWTVTLYHDANGDGVLQAGEISAGAITSTGSLTADSAYKLIARIFVPRNSALNGQVDTTTVTATSVFDNSKSASSAFTTTVNTVNFSNISTGLTVDNASPSAGQNVTYTFALTNNGAVAATGVSFSDLLSGFTYVSSTTSQGTVNSAGNPVIFNVGTINPGATVTVTITVNVPSGATLGTVFNNSLNVTYTAGSETFTSSSNSRSVTVGVTRGVAINPTSAASSHEPDDSIKYYFTLKNTGNKKDVLLMSYGSSKSLAWKFYRDVNNNGIYDAGDALLAATDSVQFSDSLHVIAIAITPVVATDQDNDVTSFTVTSAGDNSKFQSSVATTTVDIAVVSITKVVAPIGNEPPGTQMTYTINYSNTGHGKAYNFKVVDGAPDSTTYVPNSVTLNGVSQSDASTVTNGGRTITVVVGTVNASASGSVAFKFTVN
ncbi:MAG TPA: hypothetical protein VMG34_05920 [Bacteroidota bacterium]|nr:hypothetical protein [Bacteroidota bacterium]